MTTKKTDLTDATYVKDQYRDSTNLDARIALHARFSTATRRLPEWLFDHFDLPSGARVLEIGCGIGVLWSENRARIQADWQLTLTDLSLGMVETARATGVPAAFAQCDAQAIPFASAYFDTVIASHMLYHVPDLSRALSEIRRVLKSGGRLYAATNGRDHMHELKALIAECRGVPLQMPERGFNLEYGAQHLSQYFADVQQVDYDDRLVVTEVEPLVAYVKSMFNAKPLWNAELERRLRQVISERISRDGAFRITKAAGLFTARAA